jgi:hypothetical protein
MSNLVLFFSFLYILFMSIVMVHMASDVPYSLISRIQTECELEALQVGTLLADRYNSLDENTEWDIRLHNDYLVRNLGFAGWIQMGTYKSGGKTAHGNDAAALHKKGGWAGLKRINDSSFWALDNQWLYMMGDSTQRQIWATFVSPFQNNNFERNAKNFTREFCDRQFPHRMIHESNGYFHNEGWNGKCGNNEVTCNFPGFGSDGRITYDWKHFTYEDYDEWIFGPTGNWSSNKSIRRPDIVNIQVGLHTCYHAFANNGHNETMMRAHENDIPRLMRNIKTAVERHPTDSGVNTMVIISTSGRPSNPDVRVDKCTWRFNRMLVHEAHKHGFVVLEREEIERRLLFKSEHYQPTRTMKPQIHLENPSANIIGTSLLALISCLKNNVSSSLLEVKASSLSKFPQEVSN